MLEEVVTTARKREEPLQDTPVASTVLSGQALDLRFYTDLKTMDFPAPNVNITSIGAFNNAIAVTIRGIATTDPDSTFEQSVALFADGIYLPRPAASSLDMFDVEQVEVLRGPQGTLFGRNTTAGAIQLRSKRPTDEQDLDIKLTLGEFGRADLRAAFNHSISDTVNARIAVMSQNFAGYYKNPEGERVGRDDILSFRPILSYTPNDRLDWTFIGEYHRNRSDTRPILNQSNNTHGLCRGRMQCGLPIGQTDEEFRIPLDSPGFHDAKVWGLTAEMNYYLDAGTLTWLTNYRNMSEDFGYDADGSPVTYFHVDLRDQPHDQWSTELRFTSELGDQFDYVVGAYFFQQTYKLTRITSTHFNPANDVSTRISVTGQDHDAYSLYGEVNYHATEDWTLTLGGRYSNESKDFYQELFGVGTPGPRTSQSKSWNDFGPKVGVSYNISSEAMVYFNYQRGFKSGGFNGRCGHATTCMRSFNPEEVDGLELGLKADFLDNRLRANIVLFNNEYTDLQRTTFVPLPGDIANPQETVTENASDATMQGIELELTALPMDGLRLDLSLGFLDAEYDEYCADINGFIMYDEPPTSTCGVAEEVSGGRWLVEEDHTDQEFSRAPEVTVSLSANYEYALDSGNYLNFNARYTWIDDMTIHVGANVVRPSTNLLDVSVGYMDADGRYSVTLYGKNITDELYMQGNTVVPNLFSTRTVNEPRRYGVEVAWDF